MLEVATSALSTGVYNQALHWMSIAHSKAYDYIHEKRLLSTSDIVFTVYFRGDCYISQMVCEYGHKDVFTIILSLIGL